MKKEVILILFVLILLPLTSAIEIESKQTYDRGETLLIKISGSFEIPILKQNIFLYKEHVRTPAEIILQKINQDYYISTSLFGKTSGNYSIVIENAKYLHQGETSEQDIVIEFQITEALAIFLINPAVVVAENDFSINVKNLQDTKIIVTIKTNSSETSEPLGFFAKLFGLGEDDQEADKTIELKSGETETVNFELGEIFENSLKTFEITSGNLTYKIPVYLIANAEEPKETRGFKFNPPEIEVSLATNSDTVKAIYLQNTGNLDLENITFEISDEISEFISLDPESINLLEFNESEQIHILINSGTEQQNLTGQITAKTSRLLQKDLDVSLNFIKDYIPIEEPESMESCEAMGGNICGEGEKCDGDEVDSADGKCCKGTCEVPKSSTGKIIGWSLVVLVVIILAWFFLKKFRKTKRAKPDLVKIGLGKK